MKRTYLMGSVLVLALVLLAGCMRVQTFTVAPLSAVLEAGATVVFAATDQLGSSVTVTWAVDTGPGTISAAGVYTAPATVATVTTATITATYTSGITTITGSAVATIIPPLTAEIVDAVGDTFGPGTFDVLSIATARTSTELTITVLFDDAPVLPAANAIADPGDLVGFIDFDLDESSTTGFASANATYCPCAPISAIGSELFVSLFQRNAAGNYDVISAATLVDVGDAEPAVSGDVLTLTIPLADLGDDDGITNLSSVLGDFLGPTDCMPDEGAAVTTSLEPKAIQPVTEIHAEFLSTRYSGFVWGVQTAPITL
jgi:hypothetical protein